MAYDAGPRGRPRAQVPRTGSPRPLWGRGSDCDCTHPGHLGNPCSFWIWAHFGRPTTVAYFVSTYPLGWSHKCIFGKSLTWPPRTSRRQVRLFFKTFFLRKWVFLLKKKKRGAAGAEKKIMPRRYRRRGKNIFFLFDYFFLENNLAKFWKFWEF